MERIKDRSGPRLLIADDHAIFAESLRILLERTYEVVGIVTDGRALVSEATRLKPDVLVVDVAMPLLNGLDAARRVREQAPNIKIVFLTMRTTRISRQPPGNWEGRICPQEFGSARAADSDRSCAAQ